MDSIKEKTKHFKDIDAELDEKDRREYDEIVRSKDNPEKLAELEKKLDERIAK